MARPKAFDEKEVLTKAMMCFWNKGYAATSMKDLEAATELKTSSLYNSFHSKDDMFLAALDFYVENVIRRRISTFLDGSEDPIQGVEDFLLDALDPSHGTLGLGCLVVNTSTELGPHSDVVQARLKETHGEVFEALCRSLIRAQEEGRVEKTINARKLANHIGLMFNGILVQVRVAPEANWKAVILDSLYGALSVKKAG